MRLNGLIWPAFSACLILALSSCASPGPQAWLSPMSEPSPTVSFGPPASAPTPTPAPGPASIRAPKLPEGAAIVRSREALAERLGLSPEAVEVISVTRVEMPIENLGCGPTEAQVEGVIPALVIGQEIVLRAGGQEYVFRSDGRRLILCRAGEETMAEPMEPEGKEEIRGERAIGPAAGLVAQAVADLAGRLAIAPDAVQVRAVEAVEWPDASLGCPQPGMMYAQVITPGYRIVLEAAGKTYEYHSSYTYVVYCAR
ncbi:MAG: hypothetical protein RML36_15530 [Anaerolineae bacterium]|nr:hypothetical protein [Anaerolineae bacterium]MDW8100884.1 hypothetical protein [Anaerolineae bacterium]